MRQCQTTSRESLNPLEHKFRGQCGEFTSIFTYLLNRTDPENVDLKGSRIVTVGRWNNEDLDWDRSFFPACVRGQRPPPVTYGCSNLVSKFGIWSPRDVLGPSDMADPGSRVDRVELCDLYGDDVLADLDEIDLKEGSDN